MNLCLAYWKGISCALRSGHPEHTLKSYKAVSDSKGGTIEVNIMFVGHLNILLH